MAASTFLDTNVFSWAAPTCTDGPWALGLRARWQLSFHDALIVAAALTAGCRRLITEDLQHGQQIESLTIENPYLA